MATRSTNDGSRGTGAGSSRYGKIVVEPQAFCIIALHASQHRHESVHGFLLGTLTDDKAGGPGAAVATVTGAVPVSHGAAVTQPLAEVALGLCEQASEEEEGTDGVIGWYTAPRLLLDTRPGPVDVRVAASLSTRRGDASSSGSGILLVMQNTALGAVIRGDDSALLFASSEGDGAEIVVRDSAKAARAAREAIQQGLPMEDFADHLEKSTAAESSWRQYSSITDLIRKC
jgi:hypothetical protein